MSVQVIRPGEIAAIQEEYLKLLGGVFSRARRGRINLSEAKLSFFEISELLDQCTDAFEALPSKGSDHNRLLEDWDQQSLEIFFALDSALDFFRSEDKEALDESFKTIKQILMQRRQMALQARDSVLPVSSLARPA